MISEERLQDIAGCQLCEWHIAFARAVEAEAYEAAAKVCEAQSRVRFDDLRDACAAAIRALKDGE